MDTPRNVYKVSTQNPGSDVAAETAAALAAASIVFKDSDPSYSGKLLHTAMKVNTLTIKLISTLHFHRITHIDHHAGV